MFFCHLYFVAVLTLCLIMMPLLLQWFPVTHTVDFEDYLYSSHASVRRCVHGYVLPVYCACADSPASFHLKHI